MCIIHPHKIDLCEFIIPESGLKYNYTNNDNMESEMKKDLKSIRKELGLRQLDVALRAGCGIATIGLAEGGYGSRLSPKLKKKIAKALGHRVQDVFPEATTSGISKKTREETLKQQ